MAFADIVTHAASDAAIQAITPFAKGLSLFAHNFSPANSSQYAGVNIPVYNLTAKDITTQTNSWYNLDEIGGKVVNLSKRIVAGVTLDDTDVGVEGKAGFGEANLTVSKIVTDATVAVVKTIEQSIAANVYAQMTADKAETQSELTTFTLASFGKLIADASTTIDPSQAVLVLNPEVFYKLYAVLPANVIYQQTDPISDGVLRNVLGLKAVLMSTKLPVGVKGYIVADGAMGLVNRLNKPVLDGYFDKFEVTTMDGLSIGFRAYEDLRDGAMKFAGDCLFGVEFLQVEEGKAKGTVAVI